MAFINTIPEITIFIIALSIAISIGSVLTRKQFTDVEQTKKQQKELDNYNKYQDAIKDNKIVIKKKLEEVFIGNISTDSPDLYKII